MNCQPNIESPNEGRVKQKPNTHKYESELHNAQWNDDQREEIKIAGKIISTPYPMINETR